MKFDYSKFYMQPKLHRIAKKLSHWLKKSTNAHFTIFFKPTYKYNIHGFI